MSPYTQRLRFCLCGASDIGSVMLSLLSQIRCFLADAMIRAALVKVM